MCVHVSFPYLKATARAEPAVPEDRLEVGFKPTCQGRNVLFSEMLPSNISQCLHFQCTDHWPSGDSLISFISQDYRRDIQKIFVFFSIWETVETISCKRLFSVI